MLHGSMLPRLRNVSRWMYLVKAELCVGRDWAYRLVLLGATPLEGRSGEGRLPCVRSCSFRRREVFCQIEDCHLHQRDESSSNVVWLTDDDWIRRMATLQHLKTTHISQQT